MTIVIRVFTLMVVVTAIGASGYWIKETVKHREGFCVSCHARDNRMFQS